MSLIIKGMDIPSSCQPCKLKRFAGSRVLSRCKPEVLYECPFCDDLFALKNKRQPSCKLEHFPTNHGRLIDVDKLYDVVETQYKFSSGKEHTIYRDILDLICSTETVIEAEE